MLKWIAVLAVVAAIIGGLAFWRGGRNCAERVRSARRSMPRMKPWLVCLVVLGCRAATPNTAVAPQQESAKPPAVAEEIGSSRNSRVAIPRGAERGELVYFASELTDEQRRELAEVAPHVKFVVGLSREDALARAGEAHAADARYASSEFLRAAKRLAWVQAQSAGVDRYLSIPELKEERLVFTNMRAVHGPAIADHAFAMLLALTRDLPFQLAARDEGRWQPRGSDELAPIALQERTLLVVGLGGIGTEIARRGHGFGMRVLALRRSDDPAPDYVERVGKPGELKTFLADSDVVAICVPLTAETEHMFDRSAFAAMKPGSYLINIARGKVVDSAALVEALDSGRLAGACLDVTDPEPLPSDHPLWRRANVVITPHVAARAELTDERAWLLFRENVRRFDAGEPLLNVVDLEAGY